MYQTIPPFPEAARPTYSRTKCIGVALSSFIWFLYFTISTCFTVSGISFNIAEYDTIPDCASAYRIGAPLLTVFTALTSIGLVLLVTQRILPPSSHCWFLATIFALVALVDYRYIVEYPDTSCNIAEMWQLDRWARWLVVYHTICAGMWFWLGFVACLVSPGHSKPIKMRGAGVPPLYVI